MLFHVAAAFAGDVLKLAARGLERIVDRQVNVLIGARGAGLAADGNICGIGNGEMDADAIAIALAMAVLAGGRPPRGRW